MSFATRLLLANPGAQVTSALTGSLTTPGAKSAFVPEIPGAYDALGAVTVGAGGVSTISFTGIPQTGYNHLQMRLILKTTGGSNSDGGVVYRFNGDSSSSYVGHTIRGSGSSVTSYGGTGTAAGMGFATGSNSNNTNTFATFIIDIFDYANLTKSKTTRSLDGYELPGVEGSVFLTGNAWLNYDGINSITFSGATFVEHSRIALYGVK